MRIIDTEAAPAAIGVYSQAIAVGDVVYLSGQIPLHPKTMDLCSEDIVEQIHQVFKNIEAVCQAAGGSLSRVVKLNVYLIDLKDFSLLNDIMPIYFDPPYPARAVLGVAALPRNAKIEIDAIMVKGQ